ncbi:MAG: hypothetical protein AAFU49_17680, partial [Pseudomonadota bacterium]
HLQIKKDIEEHLGPEAADRRRGKPTGPHFIFGASQQEHFPSAEYLKRTFRGRTPALTADHTLLFRFVCDEEVGHRTNTGTYLEFWITREDLEKQIFDNIVVWDY